jgi:hypothetical protein
MNDLEANRTMCQTMENMTSSVEFCGLTKDLTGCKMNTNVPTLHFTAGGSSDAKGTNWLLWGGVGVGVVVVIGVVAFMMKGKGSEDDYGQAE